jgi:hypothetical protein
VRRLLGALEHQEPIDPLAMLALADALEEAGCSERPLLDHCRENGPHGFGCWVIEVLLGRAGLPLAIDKTVKFSDRRRCW